MNGAWPLVGRAEESRLITTAVGRSVGNPGVVVAGAAGVGKTRLAREALERIHVDVRWVAASASAQGVPLAALARWAPQESADPGDLVQTVLNSIVAKRNGRRVVVAVDDAHLLDDLSVFLLQQLVMRRLAPVVVIVRTGEPVPDGITALLRDCQLQHFEVQPLSQADCVALLESALNGRLDPVSAHQLWRLTRGNALYLRHVVDQELAENRLRQYDGTWTWSGDFVVPPTLTDLIALRIGNLASDVAEVVDLLAVAEPLGVDMLSGLAGTDALEKAEARGLVAVEYADDEYMVRLAHPMYGEVRRARPGSLRLRRLRGAVAKSLNDASQSDVQAALRRAVLVLGSNLEPDAAEMMKAAEIAVWMFDLKLAAQLAKAATEFGGGWPAQLAYAGYLLNAGEIDEADSLLAAMAISDIPKPGRFQAEFLRAWVLHAGGRPEAARAVSVAAQRTHHEPSAAHAFTALAALMAASRGEPREAVEGADAAMSWENQPDLALMLAMVAKAVGIGDIGRADELDQLAQRAHELGEVSTATGGQRLTFTEFKTWALRLAGYLAESATTIDGLRSDGNSPDALWWIELMTGCTLLAEGRAEAAAQKLGSGGPNSDYEFDSLGWVYRYRIDLAQAYAISGNHEMAENTLSDVNSHRHSAFEFLSPARILSSAWVRATQGWVSGAITEARQAADTAAARGQWAQELVCLQAATRFGDATTAPRLAELAAMVHGPRAPAAAAHALALAAGDGNALDAASQQLEAMGDQLAAADAAAHAAAAHTRADDRALAFASTARAHRLADACGLVITPALAAVDDPLRFTAREREIVSMTAHGLTHRQIAERLHVSVRTVRGHVYRASAKASIAGRTGA